MRLYISAAKSRNKLPKYEIELKYLRLSDDQYNAALEQIYNALAPFNDKLNLFCKCIEVDKQSIKLIPKIKVPKLTETTSRNNFESALRVLLAKLTLELTEFIDEYNREITKAYYKKDKISLYKMICKVLTKKYGKPIKQDYDTYYYIDEIPGGLESILNTLREFYDKYNLSEYGYDLDDLYFISPYQYERAEGFWNVVHREAIRIDKTSYSDNTIYFIPDPETNDYIVIG